MNIQLAANVKTLGPEITTGMFAYLSHVSRSLPHYRSSAKTSSIGVAALCGEPGSLTNSESRSKFVVD
jgi:hypothetical protein